MSSRGDATDLIFQIIEENPEGIIAQAEDVDEYVSLILELDQHVSEGRPAGSDVDELKSELFAELCLKDYLDQCEPAFCVHRRTGNCEYIKITGQINQNNRHRISP